MRFLATPVGGFFELLRNKATLGTSTFVAAFSEFGHIAEEGAILGALVTNIERERLVGDTLLFGRAGFEGGETFILQTNATPREPEGFGHLVNHPDFIVAGGCFRAQKAGEELIEVGLRFARQDFELARKAVFGGVLGNDRFTRLRDRARAELGIGTIGEEFGLGDGCGAPVAALLALSRLTRRRYVRLMCVLLRFAG